MFFLKIDLFAGLTKELPLYFRQIGFPCPASENPAIYYCELDLFFKGKTGLFFMKNWSLLLQEISVSLATIDRETTERYRETQEQALKLVDLFKVLHLILANL